MSKNIIAHEHASYERGESGTIVRSGCTLVLDSQATRRYHAHEALRGMMLEKVKRRTITHRQFDAISKLTSARGASKNAARLVLVDGLSQVQAAESAGISPAGVCNAVQRLRAAMALAREAVATPQ